MFDFVACSSFLYKRLKVSESSVVYKSLSSNSLAWGEQHPSDVLFHLAGGCRLVVLPSGRLGRVCAGALRPVLYGGLEGLPHLGQGRLLRDLLVCLLHPDPSPAHRGDSGAYPLQSVPLLLLTVGQRHPQQPTLHREATDDGETHTDWTT